MSERCFSGDPVGVRIFRNGRTSSYGNRSGFKVGFLAAISIERSLPVFRCALVDESNNIIYRLPVSQGNITPRAGRNGRNVASIGTFKQTDSQKENNVSKDYLWKPTLLIFYSNNLKLFCHVS